MDITVEEWNTEMGREKDRKRERGTKVGGRSEEGPIEDYGERQCLCLRTDSGSRSN